jgi:hypothetical protein
MKAAVVVVVMAVAAVGLVDAKEPDHSNPLTNFAEWKGGRPTSLPGIQRPKVESVLLYCPEKTWTYSHHPHLTYFQGRFYAIWSNGRKDEDTPGQRVLFARSDDFTHWTEPRPLVDSLKDAAGVERVLTAAGFHQHDGRLVAYVGNYGPRRESTRLEALTTTNGEHWSALADMGVPVCPNHGPQATRSGRLIIAGNISFPYTDDPAGLTGWRMAGIYPPVMSNTTDDPSSFWTIAKRAKWPVAVCEGSFYQTDDGRLHMLLRSTGWKADNRLWLSESQDDGATWSTPVATQFSNCDAKFHFGRLPDGRFYYVGNPLVGNRSPLVLSLSRDGLHFDAHYVLGETHYEMRRPGQCKGGEYGYPHTLVHDAWLYVVCSRQKEAVEVLRVAIAELRSPP